MQTASKLACSLALALAYWQGSTFPVFAQSQVPDSSIKIMPSSEDPVLIYRDAGSSPEQEAKIRQLAEVYEKAARVRILRLKILAKQLNELSYQAEIDEKAILALQDEINQLQNSLNTERLKLMLNIRQILSSEQRLRLVEILKSRASGSNQAGNPTQTSFSESGTQEKQTESFAQSGDPGPDPRPAFK